MDPTRLTSLRQSLAQILFDRFSPPEILEGLAKVSAFVESFMPAVAAVAIKLQRFATQHRIREKIEAALLWWGRAVQQVEASPPSPGYEPLLMNRGMPCVLARFSARTIVQVGRQVASRSRNEAQAIPAALRRLSQPGCRPKTVAKTAATLRALPEADDSIVAVFERMGCFGQGRDVVTLLDRAAAEDPIACRGLLEIAQSVASRIETRRGRPVTFASATHELFLEFVSDGVVPVGYTYDAYQESFTDPATRATAIEFELASFDPRPAVRRRRRIATQEKKAD